MKRGTFLVLVVLIVVTFASTCFAFPSAGKYESESILLYEDNTSKRYGSLWTFEVQQSDQYSGRILFNAKGVWIGNWTAPLEITKSSDGRYSLEVIDGARRSHWVAIEENQDGSITLYGLSNQMPLKNLKVTLYKNN